MITMDRLRRWAGKDFVWLAAFLVAGAGLYFSGNLSAETAFHIPPPAVDMKDVVPVPATAAAAGPAATPSGGPETGPGAEPQTMVLAGGCFWGVQAVFQHTRGVIQAVSGYAGGAADTASYDKVTSGTTGHAESVKVTYDPSQISYGQLLQIYFSVVHDPTQLNRQGPDVGSHYRSAIFVADEAQKQVAQKYIAQLDEAKAYPRRIVTEVAPLQGFYPAEAYHQDYATRHPEAGYIIAYDKPKIENLKKMFPERYRNEPQLVGAKSAGLVSPAAN
jgi:peptide-methionine (S)-S-oxide reductase